MIKQIYGNTLSRVPQCVRSLIPQSLSGRILCVATFVFAAVALYYSRQSASPFKLELDLWVKQEGGKVSEAAARILQCYESGNDHLDLSRLGLKTLPACLGLLTSLNQLYVSGNKLKSLPESMGELKALTKLNVSENKLESLPKSMGELKALTKLNVSGNKLKSLPDWIGELKALTKLYVSGNELKSLPESVGGLKALTSLDVSGNELKSLPDWIGELKALTELYVIGNELKSLPDWIGELKALTELYVFGNKLESLPDRIGELKALTSLDVSGNELKSLPDSIGGLKALTWLDVSSNLLKSLPESLGELKALRELNVSWNELESLPESLGELKALRELDVFRNKLESLPDRIGELKALTKLYVSSNLLKSLPDSIGGLKALRELDVSENKLESLPESLGKLESLEILSACKNPQMESLPENLSMLSKLQEIDLEGCRSLTSIPESWLTLRRECEIVLSRSGLSERYIQHLREITSDADYNGPRIQFSMGSGQNTDMRSLKELLAEIYEIAGCDQPAQLLTNASEFVKGSLRDWLSRLSDTYEYRNGGARKKAGLAKKITEYLELAGKSLAFYDAFISLIEGETRDCGDRISLSIMRLGVMKRLVEFDMSDMKGLAELLKKGVWTIGLPAGDTPVMGLLEQCALAKMETMRLYDDVEVILAYPVKLKEALDLPVDIEDIIFYSYSYVTEDDIDAAKAYTQMMWEDQEAFHQFLIGQAKWQEALKHNYPDYSPENALQLTKKALQA